MEPPSPAQPLASLQVLIVDPWPEEWDDVISLLLEAGVTISLVATGEDALRAAWIRQPHMVLIEVSLPAGEGRLASVQVVSRLREIYPDLPIVLVSTFGTGAFWLNYERFQILLKRVPSDLVTAIGQVHTERAAVVIE